MTAEPGDLPDADLLAHLRRRPEVMGVLYARHAPAVFRYLARRVGAAAAEDLLGDVFVAAVAARERVRPHASGSALPWLYGIAGNVVRAYLRRRAAPAGGTAGGTASGTAGGSRDGAGAGSGGRTEGCTVDWDGAGNGDDAEMFVIVGDLLRESPAPPALRKALWEVAAGIPGVHLGGAVTDRAGRAGTAIDRDDSRYVVDPDTGRLLEEGMPGGGWTATYLEQGPADSAPAPDAAYVKAQQDEYDAKVAATRADQDASRPAAAGATSATGPLLGESRGLD